MNATVFEANCPECHKRVRASREEDMRARMHRHARNCAGLRETAGLAVGVERLPKPEVKAEAGRDQEGEP